FSFKSPWMRWRLGQILDNVLTTGATNTSIFNTGLFPQEVYWRLRDIEEGRGFTEAFQITSEYIEEIQIPRLQFQLASLRWLMVLPSILVGLAIMLGMQATSFEMRSVLAQYNQATVK
ncbi:MAG: hypothetical protein QM520_03655, partial [Gammaproteobacteria bacterium]|nr:hypothetical protein [Gammaproteobacteria bacterium]